MARNICMTFALVLLMTTAVWAAPTYNYPDTAPAIGMQLSYGSVYGNNGAYKSDISLYGAWTDELLRHKVGLGLGLGFGRASDNEDTNVFFDHIRADYYYTAWRMSFDQNNGGMALRVGTELGLFTLRWNAFKADDLMIQPGMAFDVHWNMLFAWCYAGVKYEHLFYDYMQPAFGNDRDLVTPVLGNTLGVYVYDRILALMVETSWRKMVYPVEGSSYIIMTPGMFYHSGALLVGAGWEVGLNEFSRDYIGEVGLRIWAGYSF